MGGQLPVGFPGMGVKHLLEPWCFVVGGEKAQWQAVLSA